MVADLAMVVFVVVSVIVMGVVVVVAELAMVVFVVVSG